MLRCTRSTVTMRKCINFIWKSPASNVSLYLFELSPMLWIIMDAHVRAADPVSSDLSQLHLKLVTYHLNTSRTEHRGNWIIKQLNAVDRLLFGDAGTIVVSRDIKTRRGYKNCHGNGVPVFLNASSSSLTNHKTFTRHILYFFCTSYIL
jgi:hypothetical protein